MENIERDINEVTLLANHYASEMGFEFDKGHCESLRNAVRRAVKTALLEAQIQLTDLNRAVVISL